MKKLSQRDSRWSNDKLGFSNTTIGGYGCTITCLAMILGTTPDVVNQKLIDVNGYAQGNLVIWNKIKEAFPGSEVHRVWSYNNEDVKNNTPNVLVEVDGKPIGGYRHWVVYKGNQRMLDPWDGKEKSTKSYPNPLSYCIVKPPQKTAEYIPIEKKTFEMLVNKSTKYDEFSESGYESVQKIKDIIEGHKSVVRREKDQRESTERDLRVEKEKHKQTKKELAEERENCSRKVERLISQINELKKDNPNLEKVIADYESQLVVSGEKNRKLQTRINELELKMTENKVVPGGFFARLMWLIRG